MASSLNDVLNQASTQFENIAGAKTALEANYEQLGAKADEIAAINRANASDVYLAALTQRNGELAAQRNILNIAGILGTDMNASSQLIVEYGQQMRDRGQEAKMALDTIAAKEKVGLFDNPIEWIMNQITIGDDYAKYNAAVDQHNFAASKLTTINNLTQESAQTENAIKQTITAESVAANARALASTAVLAAKNAELEKLKFGNAALKDINTLDAQALDIEFKKFSAIKQDEQLQMQRAQFAVSQQQADLMLEQRTETIADKQKAREDIELKVKAINAGRAVQNLPAMNLPELKIWESDPKKRELVQGWLSSGLDAMATGGKRLTIAATPGAAAITLMQSRGSTTSPSINKLLTTNLNDVLSGKVMQETTMDGQKLVLDRKNPDSLKAILESRIQKQINTFNLDVESGGADNIYAMPSLKAIAENSPAVRESEFFKKVLAPVVTTGGMQNLNATMITKLAAAALQKGIITFDQAVGGPTQIYTAGVMLNNKVNDYGRVGLPAQKNAIATASTGTVFAGINDTTRVDGVYPPDWAQAISKELRATAGTVGYSLLPQGTNIQVPR